MNKFNPKDKRLVVAYVFLFILALVLWGATYYFNQPKLVDRPVLSVNTMTNDQLDDLLIGSGLTVTAVSEMDRAQKEAEALSLPDYRYLVTSLKLYSDAANAIELPDEKSNNLYGQLLSLYQDGDYNGVVDSVKKILQFYNLTNNKNQRIIDIMQDSSLMSNYDGLKWLDKEETLQSLMNPDSFVVSVMNAYPRRREAVIFDLESLSPISTGKVTVIGTTLLDSSADEWKSNSAYMQDVRNVYRIDFSYGEYDALYAYVLETNDNVLRMSGIYSDKQYEFMRTVSWWMQLGQDREKGV